MWLQDQDLGLPPILSGRCQVVSPQSTWPTFSWSQHLPEHIILKVPGPLLLRRCHPGVPLTCLPPLLFPLHSLRNVTTIHWGGWFHPKPNFRAQLLGAWRGVGNKAGWIPSLNTVILISDVWLPTHYPKAVTCILPFLPFSPAFSQVIPKNAFWLKINTIQIHKTLNGFLKMFVRPVHWKLQNTANILNRKRWPVYKSVDSLLFKCQSSINWFTDSLQF